MAQGWENRGSIGSASAVGTMLGYISLVARQHYFHYSLRQVPSEYNSMAGADSCITHLFNWIFLMNFRHHFLQNKPCRFLHLPSAFRQQLTDILLNKRFPNVCLNWSTRKTPSPVNNSSGSMDLYTSHHTSKVSTTPSCSYRFFLSVSAPAFYPQEVTPNRRNW